MTHGYTRQGISESSLNQRAAKAAKANKKNDEEPEET